MSKSDEYDEVLARLKKAVTTDSSKLTMAGIAEPMEIGFDRAVIINRYDLQFAIDVLQAVDDMQVKESPRGDSLNRRIPKLNGEATMTKTDEFLQVYDRLDRTLGPTVFEQNMSKSGLVVPAPAEREGTDAADYAVVVDRRDLAYVLDMVRGRSVEDEQLPRVESSN